MVAPATIKKLTDAIDAIAAQIDNADRKPLVVIEVPDVMDQNEVIRRHYKLFPDDRDPEQLIILTTWYANEVGKPKPGENPRVGAAWRSLWIEGAGKHGREAWRRMLGERRIVEKLAELRRNPNEWREIAGWIGITVQDFGVPREQALHALTEADATAEAIEAFHKAIARDIEWKADEERKRYERFPTGAYAGLPEKMTTDQWVTKYGVRA
jgi:hypothetical protein